MAHCVCKRDGFGFDSHLAPPLNTQVRVHQCLNGELSVLTIASQVVSAYSAIEMIQLLIICIIPPWPHKLRRWVTPLINTNVATTHPLAMSWVCEKNGERSVLTLRSSAYLGMFEKMWNCEIIYLYKSILI